MHGQYRETMGSCISYRCISATITVFHFEMRLRDGEIRLANQGMVSVIHMHN